VILYLDTSSLLKLFFNERHAVEVRTWVTEADLLATSRVALPEAAAALTGRQRGGDITRRGLHELLADLDLLWAGCMVVELDERRAAELAARHGIRGFDAVHLAAALAVRDEVGPRGLAFSSFDRALLRAAAREELIVLEPGEE